VAASTLFDVQQRYLYPVLLQTVKDSALKAIVINRPNTKVQIIWHEITKAAEESTMAEIKANALL